MLLMLLIPIIILLIIVSLICLKDTRDGNRENYFERREQKTTYFHNQERKNFGKKGESCVADMLNNILSKYHGYVFNDFTFMDDKGYSTNIDHIIVCNGGFFVIETKSNKGIIYGCDDDEMWYQKKEMWQDDKNFKNPIKQNQGHINHLRRMMGNNSPRFMSMIIFPVANSLDGVNSNNVYDIDSAYDLIVEYINKKIYSNQYVDKIYNQLKQIKERYGISIDEHIENIKCKYNIYN